MNWIPLVFPLLFPGGPNNDVDGDFIPDAVDNCIFVPNPYQTPSQWNSRIGEACYGLPPPHGAYAEMLHAGEGEFVLLIRDLGNRYEDLPPGDADGDGIPNFADRCVWDPKNRKKCRNSPISCEYRQEQGYAVCRYLKGVNTDYHNQLSQDNR